VVDRLLEWVAAIMFQVVEIWNRGAAESDKLAARRARPIKQSGLKLG
jgi:hypothetical protein